MRVWYFPLNIRQQTGHTVWLSIVTESEIEGDRVIDSDCEMGEN